MAVRIETQTNSVVRIIFSDNGPGVPDEYKERIFEEFFSHRPGGKRTTGLGLAFVRRALEAHGGSVCETGCPAAGATFMLSLPQGSS